MYELINTSVPQGLVAGSHGFATVAMTKGISDVIRNRLESFCSYPHRTSVPDQRYFAENPVNWFHFLLANGDHVLGRTAPAEFDYTGRTNRLAHVLHFGAREMPQNGGAYVLLAEADRLSEPWTGSPRYLAEDKVTVGRLRLAADPADREPTHWISLFGAQGVEYARRFALLLNQNLQGTNKCIYYKTTAAADVEGKLLLGLFSDLINLLPDRQLAAQVTFSTFSDCVPAGVVCHLRGIYDRNPAFESVAPFQPWVDCENRIVHHPELLPTETLSVETESAVRTVPKDWSVDYPAAQAIVKRTQQPRRPITEVVQSSSKDSDWILRAWLIGCVVLLLVGVVVSAYMYSSSRAYLARQAKIAEKERHLDEAESWFDSKMNEISEIRQGIAQSKMIPDLDEWSEALHRVMQKDQSYDACSSCQGKWNKIELKCRELDKGIANKKRDFEEAEQKKSQQKSEEKKSADEQVEEVRPQQENRAPQKRDAPPKELKDLEITEVVFTSDKWEKKLTEEEKRKLTKDDSIVNFYFEGNSTPTPRKKEMRQGDLFPKPPQESSRSRWLVVYIPNLDRVYWQWNKIETPLPLFKEKETVDLSEIVFGGDKEAEELYRRYLKREKTLIYVLEKYKDGKWEYSHFTSSKTTQIDTYTQNMKELSQKERQLEEKKCTLDDTRSQKSKLEGITNSVHRMLENVRDIKGRYKKADSIRDKHEKDKEKKRINVDKEVFGKNEEWVDLFRTLEDYGIKGIVRNGATTNQTCIMFEKIVPTTITKKLESLISHRGKDITRLEAEIPRIEQALNLLRESVRNSEFKVGVCEKPPEDFFKSKTPQDKNAVERWKNSKELDWIRNPSGVGGN